MPPWPSCKATACELLLLINKINFIRTRAAQSLTSPTVGHIVQYFYEEINLEFLQACSKVKVSFLYFCNFTKLFPCLHTGPNVTLRRRMIRTGQVYTALRSTRAFMTFDVLSSKALTCWNLLQPLLLAADGVLVGVEIGILGAEEREVLKVLHRTGHLHTYEDLGHSFYAFHTPLHQLYYQDQMLKATVERVVRDDGQGCYVRFLT